MANKIRITPSELTAQAAKIKAASIKSKDISVKSFLIMNKLSNGLSGKFKSNMDKKGKKLLKNLNDLAISLDQGATVAENCAKSYENMDKELRKQIGDSLPQDVVNAPVSTQSVYRDDFENLNVEKPTYSGPCNMAAIANLINRKRYIEGKSDYVTWEEIRDNSNGGSLSAGWTGRLKNGIQNNYGYSMVYEAGMLKGNGAVNIDYVKTLCEQRPEGIVVYAQGSSPHGVVLSVRNGEFYLTDSSTGQYTKYEDSWMAKKNGLGSVEALLANAYNIYYIQ